MDIGRARPAKSGVTIPVKVPCFGKIRDGIGPPVPEFRELDSWGAVEAGCHLLKCCTHGRASCNFMLLQRRDRFPLMLAALNGTHLPGHSSCVLHCPGTLCRSTETQNSIGTGER